MGFFGELAIGCAIGLVITVIGAIVLEGFGGSFQGSQKRKRLDEDIDANLKMRSDRGDFSHSKDELNDKW